MGRVADAMTKAFAKGDGLDVSTPTEDPWQLAETPAPAQVAVVPLRPKDGRRPTTEAPSEAPSPRPQPAGRIVFQEVPAPIRPGASPRDPRYDGKLLGDNSELPLDVQEQYGSLAATVHQSARQAGTGVLLVASARPGEGRTLVSSNLAEALSRWLGLRVLLVDGNLGHASIHSVYGLADAPGLAESLESDLATPVPVVQLSPQLSVIVAGRPSRDPVTVVTRPAMRQLLEQAGAKYDWVIIDGPPLGSVADAVRVGAMVDKVMLVIKAGETPYPAVLEVLRGIDPERVLGVALNHAGPGVATSFANGMPYEPTLEAGLGMNRSR